MKNNNSAALAGKILNLLIGERYEDAKTALEAAQFYIGKFSQITKKAALATISELQVETESRGFNKEAIHQLISHVLVEEER